MTREIWNGVGELPDEAAYYTLDNGEIKGRDYVRQRVKKRLSRWARFFTAEQRDKTLAATVENDEWMSARNGSLVSAICREALERLFRPE